MYLRVWVLVRWINISMWAVGAQPDKTYQIQLPKNQFQCQCQALSQVLQQEHVVTWHHIAEWANRIALLKVSQIKRLCQLEGGKKECRMQKPIQGVLALWNVPTLSFQFHLHCISAVHAGKGVDLLRQQARDSPLNICQVIYAEENRYTYHIEMDIFVHVDKCSCSSP